MFSDNRSGPRKIYSNHVKRKSEHSSYYCTHTHILSSKKETTPHVVSGGT
jgi:hypothetical protein